MADEYTPTTEVERDGFALWLAAHDGEVAAKAWDEGANAELARARSQGADNPDIPHPVNPYRKGAVDDPR